MLTIAIPQLYCGASGKKGAYNRQEVGLARALAARGCRAVVLYPAVGARAVETEEPAPGVKILYVPAKAWRVHAFYSTWQPLLDEQVDAVHVMGDNSLGVPGLYRFCQEHGIFFYSQLGAVRSDAHNPVVRAVMDLLCRRNLAIYRKTPTYAKTLAVERTLEECGVPCAGVLPVGLDTAIIPEVAGTRAELRAKLGLDPTARLLLFVGRLDTYKRPWTWCPCWQLCRKTGKRWSSATAPWPKPWRRRWGTPGWTGVGCTFPACPTPKYMTITTPATCL